ncbi:Uncharacterised protein [Bordetella pertussis]|nr:Uncharacterised protein [Bordetella pertussis]
MRKPKSSGTRVRPLDQSRPTSPRRVSTSSLPIGHHFWPRSRRRM